MRKEEFDRVLRQEPFQPFEVRLVDGRTFKFRSRESFIVTRSAIITVDEKGDGMLINLGLIATGHRRNGNGGKRKP